MVYVKYDVIQNDSNWFYLEDAGKDAADERSKVIFKCNRQVHKQHEVAVSDVGGVTRILGRVFLNHLIVPF